MSLSAALRDVVNGWAEQVRSLGLEAKGLWLVDVRTGVRLDGPCLPVGKGI